ncbi:MAG: stage II sporulation protein M, partial [Dactylosporangium sp.]|nr:stage II sporulation protein M [Dactylosporangium sp.]NNJ60243.1 stage II sporulation protein M [Dactylosporangium sp.]
MDLDAYVTEHGGEWRRLEYLSAKHKLTAAEVDELVALYQRAATHLSVVRSRSPDPTLVSRLSRLVLGARSAITGGRTRSWSVVGRFFTTTFPLAVYRGRAWWATVAVLCTAVSGVIMAHVAANPEVARLFLSDTEIVDIVEAGFVSYYSEYQPQDFALLVWTHNAFLSAQCLASGILILPVGYLLWVNEFNLGLIGGIMIGNGRADVFFTHILPHGLLELMSVYVAAGFGLRIGWSWIAP